MADGILVTLADINRRTLPTVLDASATQALLPLDGAEQIIDAAHTTELLTTR